MALSNFFSRATGAMMVGALAATLSVAAPQSAQAVSVAPPDTFITYQFTGQCEDCYLSSPVIGPIGGPALPPEGIGSATLVLKNFTGGAFTATNFVSFVYNSVIFSFTSAGETVLSAFGEIPGPLGGPGDLTLSFVNEATNIYTVFEAYSEQFGAGGPEPFLSQNWCIGQSNEPISSCIVNFDFGFAYELEAAVPEPATLALLGAGLLALGATRRRRG